MVSVEKRACVVEARKQGISVKQILKIFNVKKSAVYEWLKLDRETGSVEPKPFHNGRPPILDEEGLAKLKQIIENKNDITLSEMREALNIKISDGALHNAVRHTLGFRFKKRRYTHQKETHPK